MKVLITIVALLVVGPMGECDEVLPRGLKEMMIGLYAPSSTKVTNSECRQQSSLYLAELRNFTLWATQMFDASTKFPNGVLVGSTYDLGNFDECIGIDVKVDGGGGGQMHHIQGRYCLANIHIHRAHSLTRNTSAWHRIEAMSEDPIRRARNELHVALCVPAACTAEDVQIHVDTALDALREHLHVEASVRVDPTMCQVYQPNSLTIPDISIIFVLVLFCATIGTATSYDMLVHMQPFDSLKLPGVWHTLVMAFSAKANLVKLIGKSDPSDDGLDCIHGLKFMSICLIIMGHRIMFVLGAPIINTEFVESFYGKVEAMILLNGPIVVDTFFNISGFLVCYLLMHEFGKRKRINFIMLYVHRLVRLTPAYLVVVGFYCTLFVKIGSGPLWAEKVGKETGRCLQSWWANLLYVNNYVRTDHLCMIQSWYITCDMHLFLLSPFLVFLLHRKPAIGKAVLLALTAASLLTAFLVTFFGKLDALLLLYMNTLRDPIANPTFRNIYIPTHTRATPYFIGMAAGYLKYHIKYSAIKIPKMLVWFGWLLSLVCIEGTIFSAWIFYIPGRPYDALTSAFYGAFHRMLWSLGTSWMILAMSTGNGAFIEPIFSWRPVITLSRLAYCAFLCHGGLQLYTVATARTPFYGSIYNLIWLSLGDICMSFFLALALSLMFESPILRLEKLLLRNNKTPADHKKDDNYHKRTRSWNGVVTVDAQYNNGTTKKDGLK